MDTPSPVVIVCTVGGSAAPLRTCISCHRPSHVIYLASPQSRLTIRKDIEDGLEWKIGDTHIVTLSDFQDMVKCVQEMRSGIAEGLGQMGLPEDTPLIADITGGTKIMSAALALVMMEFKSRFSYVGGTARTKDGLGIVEPGTEIVVQDANPWDVLALREARSLAYAFNHAQFADALAIAQALADNMDGTPKMPLKRKWGLVRKGSSTSLTLASSTTAPRKLPQNALFSAPKNFFTEFLAASTPKRNFTLLPSPDRYQTSLAFECRKIV